MTVQARFPVPLTLDEAVSEGDRRMAEAWEQADAAWSLAIERWILRRREGAEFIAEDAVLWAAAVGFTTTDSRAAGAIVKALSRRGAIEPTGKARRAKTSHGSLKPVWRRCATTSAVLP